ncbi:hypothetical protein L1987_57648 [Smallanthus sonchifolius]|uniref:Uncharacterized protein n=1 Tax=Smallanthus sonchifolius TaxID=185202 RepID=A0ACB9DDQ6_9ASTR|nr:hypothetical protein L1987_57648 [Smallanthus sonchifolius]
MSDVLRELETAHEYQVRSAAHPTEHGGLLSIKKNQNPVWKETFKFTLEKPTKAILKLAVLSDWSSWGNNLKENLGDVDISVADVVKEKHMDNIYNIGDGQIHVELQWEPSSLQVNTKPKILQFMSSVYNYTFSKWS